MKLLSFKKENKANNRNGMIMNSRQKQFYKKLSMTIVY